MGVEWLQKLKELACNAEYVLPARKLQSRMLPHVCESTLGVAMGKVKHGLPHFTVHDFRRTARTHLAALGVEPHVRVWKVSTTGTTTSGRGSGRWRRGGSCF